MHLSPSTWRMLGLSVAAGYIGLGSFYLTRPVLAAKFFNLHPESYDSTSSTPSTNVPTGSPLAATDHGAAISTSMLLLGARDLSIGVALAVLSQERRPRAMGILINSGMILCAIDVWWMWKAKGITSGITLLAGAAGWGAIGYGLLSLPDVQCW